MKKLLNKKGFTLIEMLIVVAIMVILVAITVPNFSGATDKAKDAADAAKQHNSEVQVQVDSILADMTEAPAGD